MGQSNRKGNMYLVDSIKSNSGSDAIIESPMAYDTPYSLSGNQLVYADWVTNLINITTPVVVNLSSSDPQDYDYAYGGDVTSDTFEITAYQDTVSGRTGLDVQVPYPLYFELTASNNHILLVRSDINDVVKVIIKP